MAINTNTPRNEFTASALQTDFIFNFKVFNTTDVVVYLTPAGQTPNDEDNILTESTDYTVIIDGDNGGTVQLTGSGANDGDKITITRDLEIVRNTEYQQGGDILADTMNNEEDYQTYLIQQNESKQSRFIVLPESVQGVDTNLPAPISNSFLRWNEQGNKIINDYLNLELLSSKTDDAYIVNGLPALASEGDLAINLIDGGYYEYQNGVWVLIGQSSAGGGVVSGGGDSTVTVSDGLPATGSEGDLVFNTLDYYTYAFVNGSWEYIKAPVQEGDIVGIEVVDTVTGLVKEEGTIVFASDTNQLMKYVSGSWVQVVEPIGTATEVADASITTAKFAQGLTPVEIVDTLPTTNNFVGRIVLLTTDSKLYRYTASGFTSVVSATDLVGEITETQIADNAITSAKITANAITSNEIAANAIVAGKIAADAVTAGTVQAGAIGASEIAAGAISADKIAAGSITSDKITANAVTATKIAAGSITSDKVAANSIIAGKIAAGAVSANQIVSNSIRSTHIQAGAISADKLQANAIQGLTINITDVNGQAGSYNGGTLALVTTNTQYNALAGVNSVTGGHGVVGGNTNGGGVLGIGNYGVIGQSTEAAGQWGFITYQKSYAAGGFYSFTGSHTTFSKENLTIGQIVSINGSEPLNINQSLMFIETSKKENDKKVIGVVSEIINKPNYDNIAILNNYKDKIDYLKNNSYKEIEINSIGEGCIIVSSKNGNIEIGDYLTSDSAGCGMKQNDDILHSYTVAKSLENVDWSKEDSTTKMISCTYHCG